MGFGPEIVASRKKQKGKKYPIKSNLQKVKVKSYISLGHICTFPPHCFYSLDVQLREWEASINLWLSTKNTNSLFGHITSFSRVSCSKHALERHCIHTFSKQRNITLLPNSWLLIIKKALSQSKPEHKHVWSTQRRSYTYRCLFTEIFCHII